MPHLRKMSYHMTLTPSLMDQVLKELRVAFPSCVAVEFDSLIPNLRLAMESFVSMEFAVSNVKLYSDRYYPQANYKSAKEKVQLEQIRLIFSTCFILLFTKHEAARAVFAPLHIANDLLLDYVRHDPDLFSGSHTSDAIGYVHYRNILKAALLVVLTKLNKRVIIDAACRLQTPPRIYSWGRSMCPELRRLAAIYHIVSGVPVEVREPRPRVAKTSNQTHTSASDKGVKRNAAYAMQESSSSGSDSDSEEPRPIKKTSRASSTMAPVDLLVDRTSKYNMADYYPTVSDLLHPLVVQGDQSMSDAAWLFPETDKNASLSEMFAFHPDYMNGIVN